MQGFEGVERARNAYRTLSRKLEAKSASFFQPGSDDNRLLLTGKNERKWFHKLQFMLKILNEVCAR